MGWKTMKDEEQRALLARAKQRGLSADAMSSEDDLVVEGRGLTLGGARAAAAGQGKAPRPTTIKPKSLEELIAAVGPGEDDREAISTSKVRTLQREQLRQLASRVQAKRADDVDHARLASIATKAAIQGVLTREDLKLFALDARLEVLLEKIDIWQWLFPTVIVRSGSTLTFSGPGVQSLVAYRLIVEPNARIVINRAPVSIDCVHLEVQ